MIKRLILLSLFLFLATQISWAGLMTPQIEVDVFVANEQGEPIKGAEVTVLFPGMRIDADHKEHGMTDRDGRVRVKGSSRFKIMVGGKKEGFYNSFLGVVAFKRVDRKNVYSNQEVQLVLRKIKNPIAMYAYHQVSLKMPELHKPIGFDLMKGDWISPYGKGISADLLLEVTGKWKNVRDHDSTLKVSFTNRGDGIVSFRPAKQSLFRSPYAAPVSGYMTEKSWRKSRNAEGKIVNDTKSDDNYIFRVRTILDEKGDIIRTYYGKIYGNVSFDGATLEDPYGNIVFTYYLNPTPNDRNLECDPKKNLLKGLKSWCEPREP